MYNLNSDNFDTKEEKVQQVVFFKFGRRAISIASLLLIVGVIILVISGFVLQQKASIPEGTIYLSLSPLPEGDNPISIYSLDVATKQIKSVIQADENRQEEYWTSSFSPDGEYMAFASLPYVEGSSKLFIIKNKESDKIEVSLDMNFSVLRNPVWSPDGSSIVFQGLKDFDANIYYTSNWFIYKVDPFTNSQKKISSGVNPLFTPEGDLLILKNDGLYLFLAEEGFEKGKKVWNVVDGRAYSNMKLNISKNGNLLIWTVPQKNKVLLISIVSRGPFKAFIKKELSSTAFWSVFSPDGKFFALQEVDIDENQEEINARLVIYNADSFEEVDRISLNNYLQESLFVSDWR